ncbi:MAG: hypothetical protein WA634_06475 [Silvibacterium sp.]
MSADSPAGEKTVVNVPHPAPGSFNPNRPPGCLIMAQLRHMHHAESGRLPKAKRDGRRPEDIHTEAEAAAYIAKVTQTLHPLRRKRSRAKKAS